MTARLVQEAGIPSGVRKLVLDRDGLACWCCGVPVIGRDYSLVPRLPLDGGGALSPENLLTLCGACRGRIDAGTAEGRGWRLRPLQDPAREPVQVLAGDDARVWLTADGERRFTGPPEPKGSAA